MNPFTKEAMSRPLFEEPGPHIERTDAFSGPLGFLFGDRSGMGRIDEGMYEEYGWASPALKNPRPNLAQLEKAVGLDHWRPRYRWASQHTQQLFAWIGATGMRAYRESASMRHDAGAACSNAE